MVLKTKDIGVKLLAVCSGCALKKNNKKNNNKFVYTLFCLCKWGNKEGTDESHTTIFQPNQQQWAYSSQSLDKGKERREMR